MKNLIIATIIAVATLAAQTPTPKQTFAEEVLQGQDRRTVDKQFSEITIDKVGANVKVEFKNLLEKKMDIWVIDQNGRFLSFESYYFDNGLKKVIYPLGQSSCGRLITTGDKDTMRQEPAYGVPNAVPYQIETVKKGGALYQSQQRRFDQFARNFLGI